MKTNYVRLIGYLGNDLKIMQTAKGKMVLFRLATSYKLKKADANGNCFGTIWHDIVAFDRTAEYATTCLLKGSRVMVEGMIAYRKFLDNNNHLRYVTEIKAHSLFNIDR